jgi:hypothetical protein
MTTPATLNRFGSTTVKGPFVNEDSADGTTLASASFARDLFIGGNLVVPGPDGPVSLSPAQLIQLNDLDAQGFAKVTNDTLSVPTLSCTNVYANTNISGPYVYCDSLVQNTTLKSGQVGGKFAIDQSGLISCANLVAAVNIQAPFLYAESIGQIGVSPKFYMSANGDLQCNSVTCQDYTPILQRVQSNENVFTAEQTAHTGGGIVFSNPLFEGVGYSAEKWGCVRLNDDDGFGIFSNNTDIIITTGASNQIQLASPTIQLVCETLDLNGVDATSCDRFQSVDVECTTLQCANLDITDLTTRISIPPAVSSGCVVHNSNIPAFFLSSVDDDFHAVLFSRKDLGTTFRQTDVQWWVAPGFKVILYGSANYIQPILQTIDNIEGTAPATVASSDPSSCVSVLVFFQNAQISQPY